MRLKELTEYLAEKAKYQSFGQVLGHAELEKQRTSDLGFRKQFFERAMDGQRLNFLDLGALGGPQARTLILREFYRVVLCEPNPTEAQRLRDTGYDVVDKICLDEADTTRTLYITEKEANSSIYKPRLEMIPLTHGGTSAVEIVQEVNVATTTIDAEELRLGISFDEIKLDVQGANLPVLQGMRTSRPFIIELEAELVPLYHDQPLFFEVGRFLYDHGYLVADLLMTRRNGRPAGGRLPKDRRNSRGIPAYGDFLFMPDWSRPEGRAIIERDPMRWATTLILNGYEDMVRWISGGLPYQFADAKQVLDLLSELDQADI